ncbi:hypothetical protein FK513_32005, partial [Klebsiella pneumoniae]|nr:hypothetical protein [Klebsiella pneumoniae]
MPHVDIKCFPRELTDEQKTALAGSVTAPAVALPNWLHRLSACSSSLHSIYSG